MTSTSSQQTSQQQSVSELGFEEAMAELEAVVRVLEEGRGGLEDAISIYERGAALRRHCEERLREARLRIDRLTLSQDGTPNLEPEGQHLDVLGANLTGDMPSKES